FPRSDRAADVLEALLRGLRESGAELRLGEGVLRIQQEADAFRVGTMAGEMRCHKLIVTAGGKSYPGCGTTGDGYNWLAALGHTIRRPRPALVPLTADEPWIHDLSGVTIPEVMLRVVDPTVPASGKPMSGRRNRGRLPPGVLIERRGSLLFTHFGLSGPAALDVSRAVTGSSQPLSLRLVADFVPTILADALEDHLRKLAANDGRKQITSFAV